MIPASSLCNAIDDFKVFSIKWYINNLCSFHCYRELLPQSFGDALLFSSILDGCAYHFKCFLYWKWFCSVFGVPLNGKAFQMNGTSNRYDITVSRHGWLTGRINVERLMIICCFGIPEYLVAKMEKSIENPIFEQTLTISVSCINLKCE